MQFFKDFLTGFVAYFRGVVFIFQHNLWLFFLIPLSLFFALYYGGEEIKNQLLQVDISKELGSIDFKQEFSEITFQGIPSNTEELRPMFIGFKLIFVILASKLNKYFVLILLSPMNTLVASKTEYVLTGNKIPFEYKQFIKDVFRGVNFALRNLVTQMLIVASWFLLTLIIPPLDIITFWVLFVVGGYFYGASLLDYTLERKKLSMDESYSFIFKNIGITLSVGLLFSSLFFTSFGIMLAPLTGVVAGTIALHTKYDLRKKIKGI